MSYTEFHWTRVGQCIQLTKEQSDKLRLHRVRLLRAKLTQTGLDKRNTEDHINWNQGNDLRHERGLTDDQETEWEIPCGKMRMSAIMARINCQELELAIGKSTISELEHRLQEFSDSLGSPAVPAAEAPAGAEDTQDENILGDQAHFMMTCCPPTEIDDEGREEWKKFNASSSDDDSYDDDDG